MTEHGREHDHSHKGDHGHSHDGHGHGGADGHSHGLVHASIKRSKAGLRAVSLSLVVLLVTAMAQVAVFLATSSVALLADLIHNFGDALTAVPLGAAFLLRSFKAEKRAGYFVVATIFISACVAAVEAVNRLINPQPIGHLAILAMAGGIGFVGNEIAAQIRLRAGRNLNSPALVADGNHARTDGFVSLAVVASAIVVALGLKVGDPIIGLTITFVILRITWQSFQTVRADPGEHSDDEPDEQHPLRAPVPDHAEH
jgi:cation diffusion facilitator family transporter